MWSGPVGLGAIRTRIVGSGSGIDRRVASAGIAITRVMDQPLFHGSVSRNGNRRTDRGAFHVAGEPMIGASGEPTVGWRRSAPPALRWVDQPVIQARGTPDLAGGHLVEEGRVGVAGEHLDQRGRSES